eukprot:scaffold277262_cov31-Tisochrysis_lutea.AAC.1
MRSGASQIIGRLWPIKCVERELHLLVVREARAQATGGISGAGSDRAADCANREAPMLDQRIPDAGEP